MRRPAQQPASTSGDARGVEHGAAWAPAVYRVLKQAKVRQASYVPDAGLARLIELLEADRHIATKVASLSTMLRRVYDNK